MLREDVRRLEVLDQEGGPLDVHIVLGRRDEQHVEPAQREMIVQEHGVAGVEDLFAADGQKVAAIVEVRQGPNYGVAMAVERPLGRDLDSENLEGKEMAVRDRRPSNAGRLRPGRDDVNPFLGYSDVRHGLDGAVGGQDKTALGLGSQHAARKSVEVVVVAVRDEEGGEPGSDLLNVDERFREPMAGRLQVEINPDQHALMSKQPTGIPCPTESESPAFRQGVKCVHQLLLLARWAGI
jgi:hypothetical protein